MSERYLLSSFKNKISKIFLAGLCLFSFQLASGQSKSTNSKTPTYKISVDARLLSQYIEHGLAISDRNPAMNAAFLFNLGSQFKLGFWGSNISNLSSTEDNFWFKILAEIKIELAKEKIITAYVSDDHYYKSSTRNGQVVGIKVDYNTYIGLLEWTNNFEGSKTDAIYFNGGKLFDFRKVFKYGGTLGYTLQNVPGLENYFDLKLIGQYEINNNAHLELGGTTTLNGSKYGSRADPALYLAFELAY